MSPAGTYGRELERVRRRHGMAQEVDAAVEAMEPTRSQALVDRVTSQPGPDQLGAGDDTVLACGECGDLPLTPGRAVDNARLIAPSAFVAAFTAYMAANPAGSRHAPFAVGVIVRRRCG